MAQAPVKRDDCDIFEDSEGRDTKHKIVRSMRFETFLNSLSKVGTFIGAPLLATGLTKGAIEYFGSAALTHGAAAGATLVAGATAGIGAVTFAAVGILAVGALFVAAAVAADFISTRIYQDKQLDMQEFNAKRAGHHIVHELQAQNMCLTKEQDSPCAQKQWAANMSPKCHQEGWTNTVDAQRQQAELAAANGAGRA